MHRNVALTTRVERLQCELGGMALVGLATAELGTNVPPYDPSRDLRARV